MNWLPSDLYLEIFNKLSNEDLLLATKRSKDRDQILLNRLKTQFSSVEQYIQEMREEKIPIVTIYKLFLYLQSQAEEYKNGFSASNYFYYAEFKYEIPYFFCETKKIDDLIKILKILGPIKDLEMVLDCVFENYGPEDVLKILKAIPTFPSLYEYMFKIYQMGILEPFLHYYLKDKTNYGKVAEWISGMQNQDAAKIFLEVGIKKGKSLEMVDLMANS